MKSENSEILLLDNLKIYVLQKDKIIFESELEKQNIEYYCDIENQPMFESGIRYFIKDSDRIKIDKIFTDNGIIAQTETIRILDYRDGKKIMNVYFKIAIIVIGIMLMIITIEHLLT